MNATAYRAALEEIVKLAETGRHDEDFAAIASAAREALLAGGNDLSEEALTKLGQAMLADYVEPDYVPSRGEIAMRAMQGLLAESSDAWPAEAAARNAVMYADALLAELSKEPRRKETYTAEHVLSFLDERAGWIDREMRNGGNLEYLRLKYEECRYIAQCIRDARDRLAPTT
jgi:hypothetical protein